MATFAGTLEELVSTVTDVARKTLNMLETPTGGFVNQQGNALGHALVEVIGGTWTPAEAAAPADSNVIIAAPTTVRAISATNAHTAARWLMLFDSATVPADGAAPRLPAISVPAETTIYVPIGGLVCTAGLSWAMSSTQATKTITSDTLHVVSAELV